MYVYRVTRVVKKGHFEGAIALIQAEMERYPAPHGVRMFSGYAAPIDTIMIDFDFKSLDEMEKHWAGWMTDPETAKFYQKFDAVTEASGANEIWNLLEGPEILGHIRE